MSTPEENLLEGIRTLLRAFTVNEARFPPAEGRIKYNAVDFQSLYYFWEHPGCKGADLAVFLGVAPTTAQSVIDRLVRRGFVSRTSGKGRAVSLTLTDEGRSVVEAIRRQDLLNCTAMLTALPEKERAAFARQVGHIASVIEARKAE